MCGHTKVLTHSKLEPRLTEPCQGEWLCTFLRSFQLHQIDTRVFALLHSVSAQLCSYSETLEQAHVGACLTMTCSCVKGTHLSPYPRLQACSRFILCLCSVPTDIPFTPVARPLPPQAPPSCGASYWSY